MQLVQYVKLNNWIKKESLAFHLRAGNALASVLKCAGSSEPWLPVAYVIISSLYIQTPDQLKQAILINYYVCVDN